MSNGFDDFNSRTCKDEGKDKRSCTDSCVALRSI